MKKPEQPFRCILFPYCCCCLKTQRSQLLKDNDFNVNEIGFFAPTRDHTKERIGNMIGTNDVFKLIHPTR